MRWSAVIVDEAQNRKNPNALQYRALRSLDAGSKFGLSGTPWRTTSAASGRSST
ncbi:MAG: hypothetical protein IPN17_36055 [Deltaproteobacteria bacterium]|nr:hypothetical protein [Deltaproteobacteria bacterium]